MKLTKRIQKEFYRILLKNYRCDDGKDLSSYTPPQEINSYLTQAIRKINSEDIVNENNVITSVMLLFNHELIEKIRNSNGDAEVRFLMQNKLNKL